MMKKIKLSICFMFTLLLLFSFTDLSVYAEDTKTVTVTKDTVFTCVGIEIDGNMKSIQNSSYSYNDGTYKGILNYYRITTCKTEVVGKSYNQGDIYRFTVTVEYTGSVTKIVSVSTKQVIVTVDKTFTCPDSQISDNMKNIQSSTYFYDKEKYRGTLNYLKIDNAKTTLITQNSSGNIYKFVVTVEYSGTVTSY